MTSTETICAVVVTYNRKQLLLNCLRALAAQTRPVDGIIVIDNASTDGTSDVLKDEGYLENPLLQYHPLSVNTGGAGGFHHGVKLAHSQGFDRLWLMDDDCAPDSECLATLLEELAPDECGAPLKITDKNIPVSTVPKDFKSTGAKIELYHLPFNGMLVPKQFVSTIGYPRSDFFMDRDDTEYCIRMKAAGLRCYWVTRARLFHPDDALFEKSYFGYRLRLPNYARGARIFYRARNLVYLHRLYPRQYRMRLLCKATFREFLALILAEFSLKRAFLFFAGHLKGWTTPI